MKPPARKPASRKPAARKPGARPARPAAPAPEAPPAPARPDAAKAKPKAAPGRPVAAKAASRKAAPARPAVRRAQDGPRVSWGKFRPMYDYWGNEIKRFYQLETLAGATELYMRSWDRFIVPSVRDVLGGAPLTRLHFELFQEGRFQLIFRLEAVNANRRRATFAFVVAKNHEECSTVAHAEHRHLTTLHERAPGLVVRPYRGGAIFLPDRHRRADVRREVYAYLTQWLDGYDELGIHKNLQFIVNVKPHHLFSAEETERLKVMMIEVIARTYDAADRTCMAMPEIASGDFVVRRGARGALSIRLIACRRIQTRMSPAKLIDQILDAGWDWGGAKLRLMPADPANFLAALTHARGPAEAAAWIRDYARAVRARRIPARRPGFLEALEELMVQ
jgi:hypothetical protein